jgi:YggT family protein
VGLLCFLLTAAYLILLARVILSWFPLDPDGVAAQIYRLLGVITEPVLGPMRRAIPPVRMGAMGLDLSPLIAFFAIIILQGILC